MLTGTVAIPRLRLQQFLVYGMESCVAEVARLSGSAGFGADATEPNTGGPVCACV